MTARFVSLLALDAGRHDGAGVGDTMAASIEPCPIAHFAAQGAAVKTIA
ncbi:hypothetical protein [Burkholderia sp. RF2-non_BP3]|nr:hypothetical protein [Burkholderia sp. RF2-non_BP3]